MADVRRILDFVSLRALRRIDIRHRLIFSFIILSLVPLVISGFLSYAESSRAIQDKTRVLFVEIVKQASRNFQLRMAQIEGASEEFMLSDRVQSSLLKYYGGSDIERVRARSDLTRVLLEKYGSFDYINQKYLLDTHYRMMDSQVFAQLGDSVVSLCERAGVEQPTWATFSSATGQKSIAMLRRVRAKGNNEVAGTLFIGIKPAQFAGILNTAELGGDSSMFILDINDGSVILKGRRIPAWMNGDVGDAALVQEIASRKGSGNDADFVAFTGKDHQAYRAAYSRVGDTSWYVIDAVPLSSLTAEPQSIRNKIFLISLVCFGFAMLFSFVIARSISAPLAKLIAIMKQTEAGNFGLRMDNEGHDEVTLLAQKFNDMAGRVDAENERLEVRVAERTRELAHATRSLEILSTSDGLTGIPNRRRFDEVLAAEIARAARLSQPLTLLMLDVDLFKNYNDFYGHQAGDDCLREVARFLQTRLRRASDMVARYGGEEFAFIGYDTDAASAIELAESICSSLQAAALPHARSPFGVVTVSIGVLTLVPVSVMSPEDLLRLADAAMYKAKNEGRNQVRIAPDPAGAAIGEGRPDELPPV